MQKMIKSLFVGIVFCCFCWAETKTVGSQECFDISETCLKNGLKIVVIPIKCNNAVVFGLTYNVGSGDDPRDCVGLSHFLEHSMFHGTQKIDREMLARITEKYDNVNAYTGADQTVYLHCCDKKFLEVVFKIEADRMKNLLFSEKKIAKEREVIIEERKMRVEGDPLVKHMVEAGFKAMFLYSNYSYPIVGYLDQIKKCDKKALLKHYKNFYVPNNATILVVGNVDKDEIVGKVEKCFGDIKKGKDVERNRVIDPEITGLKHQIEHESEQISVHNLDFIYKIKRESFDSLKKYIILVMTCDMLTRVLYQNIVDKKELSYVLDSQLDVRAFDSAHFSIATVFRENQKLDVIENEIMNVVNKYSDEHLNDEMLQKEKKIKTDELKFLKDDPKKMFWFMSKLLSLNTMSVSDISQIANVIESVTLDDIKKCAKQNICNDHQVIKIYSHPKVANK